VTEIDLVVDVESAAQFFPRGQDVRSASLSSIMTFIPKKMLHPLSSNGKRSKLGVYLEGPGGMAHEYMPASITEQFLLIPAVIFDSLRLAWRFSQAINIVAEGLQAGLRSESEMFETE
jgi:hypothetical protein